MEKTSTGILQTQVLLKPTPFSEGKLHYVDSGTIREIVSQFTTEPEIVRVYVENELVSESDWDTVPESPPTLVFIPQDPVSLFVAAVVISVGVAYYVYRNMPNAPDTKKFDDQQRVNRISGDRNRERPYEPVPIPVGKFRTAPAYAAQSYREVVGNDEYYRLLLCPGHGPVDISNIRIGDTPINNFLDVDVEVLDHHTNRNPITLYIDDVAELDISAEIKTGEGFTERESFIDADELTFNFLFPRGIVRYDDEANRRQRTVQIEIGIFINGSWQTQVVSVRGNSPRPLRRSFSFILPRGQYLTRVRKVSPAESPDDSKLIDTVEYTSLQTKRNGNPVLMEQAALIAVKIRASEQLNGIIDNLTCETQAVVPNNWNSDWTWDRTNESWSAYLNKHTWVPSRNPADMYRWFLQHPTNFFAVKNERIDLDALLEWRQYCEDNNFFCDELIDTESTVLDNLNKIASAGRAKFSLADGRWSIVIDDIKDVVVQVFTPKNSWDFQTNRIFPEKVDGVKAEFVNPEADYTLDEVIFKDPTLSPSDRTDRFDSIELWGITNSTQAQKFARFAYWSTRLRRELYEFKTDIENIICTRGDRIRIQNDVILIGIISGRIKAIDNNILLIDERPDISPVKNYAIQIRKFDGTQVQYNIVSILTVDNTTEILLEENAEVDVGDFYLIGERDRVALDCIIEEIRPEQDMSATITAVNYAPELFDLDNESVPVFETGITIPAQTRRRAPKQPLVTSITRDFNAAKLYVTLDQPQGSDQDVVRYQLQYRSASIVEGSGDTPLSDVGLEELWETPINLDFAQKNAEIPDLRRGLEYEIRVRAIGENNRASDWLYFDYVVEPDLPPANVENFEATQTRNGLILSWDIIRDPDVLFYEIRTDQIFGNPNNRVASATGGSFNAGFVGQNTTYFIKAVTRFDVFSIGTTSVEAVILNPCATNFSFENVRAGVLLTWSDIAESEIIYPLDYFEVRFAETDVGPDNATVLGRTQANRFIAEINNTSGFFYLVITDVAGSQCQDNKLPISPAIVPRPENLQARTVSNQVLLSWNEVDPVRGLSTYIVYRGDDFETAEKIGNVPGTFTVFIEPAAATITYWVVAKDLVGTLSEPARARISVDGITDFVLRIDDELDLTLTDTLNNLAVDASLNSLFACVDTEETFEEHFEKLSSLLGQPPGVISIQDAINTGYEYWLQPTLQQGNFVKVIDYQVVVPAGLVTVTYDIVDLVPGVQIDTFIDFSLDGITWEEAENPSIERQVGSYRYIRIRSDFSSTDDFALAQVQELRIRISVKKRTDQGIVDVFSTDTGGTFIPFEIDFLDVDSVVATAEGEDEVIVVVNFEDVPAPTGFRAKAFDINGNRVNSTIDWIARGV